MKIILRVRYVGSAYAGFQYQPNAPTIQKELNEACLSAFGTECDITGCSRTDSGVHAAEFVCSVSPRGERGFSEIPPIPEGKIHRVINKFLPHDISVYGACFVENDFHPRYDVMGKEYVYRIRNSLCPDPFVSPFSYHLPIKISEDGIQRMKKCAELFVGKHDFSAFMASGSDVKDTVRRVGSARIETCGEEILFYVFSDGFLYNMVRIMAGTLIDAAFSRVSCEDIKKALESGERALLGRTAPACGLCLNRVIYEKALDWKAE